MIVRVLATAGLVALLLVAAGCGGTKSPAVASLGPSQQTTTTDSGYGSPSKPSTGSFQRFVRCMQQHGVNAQIGAGGRGISIQGGPGSSALMNKAQQACQKLLPGGGPKAATPAQQAKLMQSLVALAKCMRKHGVSNFPDPTPSGGIKLDKSSLNPASPQFQAASKACGTAGPGGKGFRIRIGP